MKTGKPNKHIDHGGISRRFQEFADASRNKPYQRQKSALERQLSDFLASLSPPKRVSSCTSDDIIKFLISRDKSGRTVVHTQSCPRVVLAFGRWLDRLVAREAQGHFQQYWPFARF